MVTYYLDHLIGTTNTNLEFYNKIFVYLRFEFFYKVKVSIEVKINHKMAIDLIIIKSLETPCFVKKQTKSKQTKI